MSKPAFIILHSTFCILCSAFVFSLPPSPADSILNIPPDSGKGIKISPNAVTSKISYSSVDSMRMNLPMQKVFLFGKAFVTYEDISLKAEYIEFDLSENLVFASGALDSLGKEQGKPVFKDGDQEFKAKNMTYNFKTKKGRVKEVITQEGEGYIHGDSIYKDPKDIFYIKKGKYTTCQNEHPHFAIQASKLKVIPNDKLVTGSAYLEIMDVPTPLFLPFGIFPLKKERTSGILIPEYGKSDAAGFFLKNGGYYLGFSDYADFTLRGDAYSNGGWGLHGTTQYNRRYKYNGSFGLDYSNLLQGEIGFPDYVINKDFRLTWNHNQDAKARPGTRFTANVNFVSGGYLKYNSYKPEDHLANTLTSAVTFSKSVGKQFFSTNLGITQYTEQHRVILKMPEVVYSIASSNWFRSKTRKGNPKWYENIRAGYTMNVRNDIDIPDTVLFKKLMQRDIITNSISPSTLDDIPTYYDSPIEWNRYMRNGVNHSVPFTTSLRVMKYFNLSPTLNTNERWYLQTIEKKWDTAKKSIEVDTINKFRHTLDFMFTTPLTTQLYGMYQFRGERLQAIRHVITPSVSFAYRPDYSDPFWGYYKTISDNSGKEILYSPFANGIFGYPGSGKYNALNFSLNNNLEMKVKSKRDTINPFKKIKLFESLLFSATYNFEAEEFKLSTIAVSGRTNLFNKFNINFGGTVDPYLLSPDSQRLDEFEWDKFHTPGRLTNAYISLNFSLKSPPVKASTTPAGNESGYLYVRPLDYVDFNIPWSMNVAYTFRYTKLSYTPVYDQTISIDGNINVTQKWKAGFSSGFDYKVKKITYTTFDIIRDLHCWQMKFHWIPIGSLKSYLLEIKVKASTLEDLKLTKKKDWFDY